MAIAPVQIAIERSMITAINGDLPNCGFGGIAHDVEGATNINHRRAIRSHLRVGGPFQFKDVHSISAGAGSEAMRAHSSTG